MNKYDKGFVHLVLVLIVVISLSVIGYLAFQNNKSKLSNSQTPTSTVTPAKADNSSPTSDPISNRTTTPQTNKITLNYLIPDSWTTATDNSNSFSIAYDPNSQRVTTSNLRIDINAVSCCSSTFIKLLPYNDGSRHSFIKNYLSYTETDSTYEVEYQMGDYDGLVVYSAELSGSSSFGMINVGNGNALLIESTGGQDSVESILKTLRMN